MWPVEDIPNEDQLFLRVHMQNIDEDGDPRPRAFEDHEGGMSCDWSKYSTPEMTRGRKGELKAPNYGVLGLNAGAVREIPQEVKHTPEIENQSHSEVFGEKTPEVIVKLLDISGWLIKRQE